MTSTSSYTQTPTDDTLAMQTATPILAPQDPAAQPVPARPPAEAPKGTSVWDFAEECLMQTAALLHETRSASDQQIHQGIAIARESHASGKPADLLEIISRLQGHEEEHIGRAILELGNRLAAVMTPSPPLIPFGGKLIAPSAFYESFDQNHKIARALLSPVLYAEDTDAIGTASANPIAAAILAEEIRTSVYKRFGIRPFVTISRLDYESWTFLSRKHFEL